MLSDQFYQKPHKIAGEDCFLIFPKEMGVDWNINNLNFRSVIITKDGQRISCGWPKFTNYGEKLDLYPDPDKFHDWTVENKEDGSLVIISKFRGELIVRTRGIVSAFEHENGSELSILLDENPLITDNKLVNSEEYSLLFEWLSVKNKIILKHSVPKLVLLGIIRHKDYYIEKTETVNFCAHELNVDRPEVFNFNSLSSIIELCKILTGKEGFVLCYNNNQNRVKIKTDFYLKLHRLKSSIRSFDKVVDLFFEQKCPKFNDFYKYIVDNLDYELAEFSRANLQLCCDLYVKANWALDEIQLRIKEIKEFNGLSKKELAFTIKDLFGSRNLEYYAFSISNGKNIEEKHIRKLMEQLK